MLLKVALIKRTATIGKFVELASQRETESCSDWYDLMIHIKLLIAGARKCML